MKQMQIYEHLSDKRAVKVVSCASVKLDAGRDKPSFGKRATFHLNK